MGAAKSVSLDIVIPHVGTVKIGYWMIHWPLVLHSFCIWLETIQRIMVILTGGMSS